MPAKTPSLAEVVDRYIDWRGGAAYRAEPENFHEVANIQFFGVTGTLETWHTLDHWRTELHAPGLTATGVITAHGAWTTTLNGQVLETPDAYRYAKRDPQSAKAMEGRDGDTVALVGQEAADGRAWAVVRVSYGDADTYDAFIDPVTGELGATRTVQKGQQTFDHFSDWRWVKGVRVAFVTREVSTAGDTKIATMTQIEAGEPIDAALFARPRPTQQLVYAGGRDSTDWVPFTGLEKDRIYVPVTVNGRAATAILDSGAGTDVIDTAFAASAGLKPRGQVPLGGENGVGSGAFISNVEISLGGATLKNATITTSDIRSAGAEQPVVIGDDIFYGAVVDIDFPGRRLAIRDRANFRPPADAIVVPLVQDGGAQLVPISIEDGPPALFIMDTGFPLAMRISPQLARTQDLIAGRPSIEIAASGIGGSTKGKIASLKGLSLGGVGFSNVPVMFSDAWPSASFTDRIQGLLGIALLRRFRVIVDWPDARLYLIPAPGAADAPFAKDRLGLVGRIDGEGLRITAVRPGSPAARAGLRAGEAIDLIDGRPAATAVAVGSLPAGTRLTLVVRGEPRPTKLTLADYY